MSSARLNFITVGAGVVADMIRRTVPARASFQRFSAALWIAGMLLSGAFLLVIALVPLGHAHLQALLRLSLSLAFVAFGGLLLAHWTISALRLVRIARLRRGTLSLARKRLQALVPEEKVVLRGYARVGLSTQLFDPTDAAVAALEAASIIHRPIEADGTQSWYYALHPWALAYLQAHPDLLAD